MQIFIVQGLHPAIPGMRTVVKASECSANTTAAEMVNIMLADSDMVANANNDNWQKRLRALRRKIDNDAADVFITPAEVED